MTAFRGRFECKVDAKGRLSLPAAYRQSLAKAKSGAQFIVTNGLYRGKRCLDVLSLREWEKLEARIARLPELKPEVQAYQRFYLASGQAVPADAQNRLLIPAGLRKYADLGEDVVLVGMGRKFEIWSQPVWMELYETLAGQFDETIAAVARLEEEE